MKLIYQSAFLILTLTVSFPAAAQFSKYFYNKSLRLGYYHSGNDSSEYYTFDELVEEPYWAGSHVHLIDTFQYGKYYVKVFDAATDSLLYSRGYSTLFGEWQTTGEAKRINRTFPEAVLIPYPKKNVRIELYSRNRQGVFEKKFQYLFDTADYFVHRDHRLHYPAFDLSVTGDPSEKVDVVILPEGYTQEQMGLFLNDCRKFVSDFFKFEPYADRRDKFNFRGVLAPSKEAGTDIPKDSVWRNTILNTSYDTFDSERYLMTTDYKSVCDLAANAPHDQIYILVNSTKYGGGAIFNFYNVSVNSNKASAKILIHEFGHGFAGLADEYYNDETSYGSFYNLNIEPWEPNITTLKHFEKKWKHLVKKRTPIPTPATKKYKNKVGAFEGGGYEPKGMYRPMQDCLMKTFNGNRFCPACTEAIERMVDFYCAHPVP